LAACVFYASIFKISPVGLSFTGGLSSADALFCQQCAWSAYTGINTMSNNIPDKFYLYQNYPNPFNPVTKIRFEIPLSKGGLKEVVQLKVFDIAGREIITLINDNLNPGLYEVTWNAEKLSTGIYYISLTAGNFRETKKAVLLK
jgi:hypothetical protein